MKNNDKKTFITKILLTLNVIVIALAGTVSVYAASYLYNANEVSYSNTSSSGISSDNVQGAIDNLYTLATEHSSLENRVTALEGQLPTKLNLDINTGTLAYDRSFTIGNAVFINLKLKSINLSAATTTVVATIPSYSVDHETACIAIAADTTNRYTAICWIRPNGQIAINSDAAVSSGEIRVVSSFIK